jgi:hypothetical protein
MNQKTLAQSGTVERAERIIRESRSEMVTVVMRQEDYRALKKMGGPRPDQIHMALYHYIDTINDSGWNPEQNRKARFYEDVTTYKCTLLKSLCDDIRSLKGRFDDHTIEAIRLFLR